MKVGFMGFMNNLIVELNRMGKEQTAERYTTVRNSFMRFLAEKEDVAFYKCRVTP